MKHSKSHLLFSILVLAAGSAQAQQALWDCPPVVSPQLEPSGSVTFRISAPQAEAVSVTGDFIAPQQLDIAGRHVTIPGNLALRKGSDGVWSATVDSLAPELYSYNFIVDGVKITDPANVYTLRDISSVTNYFIVPGGKASNYAVRDVPHGTVAKVWYHSDTIGTDRRLTVYTPAGYDGAGERRYPVLYLLHGMGGDENAWTELGRAAQILDNKIAAGEAEPMIVVMTNGNVDTPAAPGESHLGMTTPTTNLPQTMDGTFESHFPEVVAFVDSIYRTIADKEHRAIAGLSMGGFHSMQISKEYPDMFDYIGLFSAAVLPREGATSPVYADVDAKLARQFADAPALYWIAIGRDDFLYGANADYRARLDASGYPYVYVESEGGHIWRNWRTYLSDFLPLLFRPRSPIFVNSSVAYRLPGCAQ